MPDRHRETIPAFADVATFQARLTDASLHDDERFGLGYEVLRQRGYHWVAARVRAVFDRAPRGATVTIETWLNPPGAVAVDRCYRLADADGPFASGLARWALASDTDGRPARFAQLPWLFAGRTFETTRPFDGFAIAPVAEGERATEVAVPAALIDRNGHLNNARYWDLVFTGAAAAGLPAADPGAIAIAYLRELRAGERVRIAYREEGRTIQFLGTVDDVGTTVKAFSGHYEQR